jgi:hypothetical protein
MYAQIFPGNAVVLKNREEEGKSVKAPQKQPHTHGKFASPISTHDAHVHITNNDPSFSLRSAGRPVCVGDDRDVLRLCAINKDGMIPSSPSSSLCSMRRAIEGSRMVATSEWGYEV